MDQHEAQGADVAAPGQHRYQRVMLKLSGEVFGGGQLGVDPDVVSEVARQIADVVRTGVEMAIVVGGGNYFRGQELSKGNISVNCEYGVVYLRGEVPDREQMDALVDRARKVDGVRGVENLTHLPNEAAPTKDEAGSKTA